MEGYTAGAEVCKVRVGQNEETLKNRQIKMNFKRACGPAGQDCRQRRRKVWPRGTGCRGQRKNSSFRLFEGRGEQALWQTALRWQRISGKEPKSLPWR